jgi:hypothetical protein
MVGLKLPEISRTVYLSVAWISTKFQKRDINLKITERFLGFRGDNNEDQLLECNSTEPGSYLSTFRKYLLYLISTLKMETDTSSKTSVKI